MTNKKLDTIAYELAMAEPGNHFSAPSDWQTWERTVSGVFKALTSTVRGFDKKSEKFQEKCFFDYWRNVKSPYLQ